jgi:hypothetical protein
LFIVWEAPTFFSTLIVWVCLLSFTHSSVCVLTNHRFVFRDGDKRHVDIAIYESLV